MGGTQEMFDKEKQARKVADELDVVKFYLDFSGNFSLFNIDDLHVSVSKEISSYLKKAGIKYFEVGVGGGGGGGVETLAEIIKTLWETKEVLTFGLSLIKLAQTAYKKRLNNFVESSKPRVNVHFAIDADGNINHLTKGELRLLLAERLDNLLFTSSSIANIIRREYPHLGCNFSIRAKINTIDYSVYFDVPQEFSNENFYGRLLKIIKNLNVAKNLFTEYSPTSWFAISRTDSIVKHLRGDFISGRTSKKYYLLFSSNIIKDWF